ncbi:MAG: TIGR03936 family radical SAM-associated protein [Coriobacteriia bacterium]|nr:TIGR03936 family radical SAM-associated protein [Coriobacteriia bacterium]
MADPNQFRLRAVFAKRGRLAMLSHLEVAHALERAVRRADLPFAISQGFSPHMKIAFGAALPVGVGGDCEIFDLQLLERVPEAEALERLQAASVPDLMVLAVRYIDPHAKAASVAYPVSQYTAVLSHAPAELPVPEEVVVVRKKKEKRLVVSDFLAEPLRLEGRKLTFALEAKATGSLRPDKLLEACLRLYNDQRGVASPHIATGDQDSMMGVRGAAVDEGSAAAEPEAFSVVSNVGEADASCGDPLTVVTCTRTGQR